MKNSSARLANVAPWQACLDLGPESEFDLLHGRHRANVGIATGRGQTFTPRLVSHEVARAAVGMYSGGTDFFVSQAGFHNLYHPSPRSLENVSRLPVIYIDLDCYNVGLSGNAEQILARAFELHPWLPMPTLIANSGRGVYFKWVLADALPRSRLSEWQSIQDALIEMLAPLGADPCARDAARVLRVVHSVNSKNGATVTARVMANPIPFERLKRAVLDGYSEFRKRHQAKAKARSEATGGAKPSKATSTKQRTYLCSQYTLAEARMQDFATLAVLRGGRLTDGRHRFLYVLAIAASWFRGSVDDVAYECEAFARRHFADPARYSRRRITTILNRYQLDKENVVVPLYGGKAAPNRYRMRTATILAILEVTPDEQRHLKTLIGAKEKARRREERRRAAGMVVRSDYLSEMSSRTGATTSKVIALMGQGMSASQIAEALGISKRRVNQLIAKARQADIFAGV
jgi:DNA-directed RNA polymerase specialized sigma24 family protein